uniref:Uncharacterized protein n=1 Tax=Panagrolaimus superbus TaxID=310955 RepID=A0A914YSK8_9BILA
MHHRNKSKGVKSVQLLTFKDSGKPFYSGYCKIGVNAILQHLNIKPYNKNINELLISLGQNYILKENILFINFLTNVPKCVLIFANRNLAQKVFEVITKNKNEKEINQDAQFLEKFPIIFNKESTDVEIMELLNVICLKIKKGEINERNYIEDGCNKNTESSRKRRHPEQNTGKKLNVCKKSRTWKLNVAKILHKPAYEIVDKNVFGSTTRKLIIFDSKNEKLCYEYFLHCGHFCCAGCRVERKVRRANICNFGKKNEYVELFNTDHFCDPQPYNPKKIPAQAKIVKKPYYEYKKADINGESKKILLIFDSIDRNLCYEYFDRGTDFRCKGCQKLKIMRIAKVYNDGAEDEYIELLNDKHACEPSFISGERFLCRNCLKNDHRVYAKLEKDKDGDEYLRHGPESHICEPQLYTIQCVVTNKAGQRESTAAKDIFRRTQATANDSRAAATSFVPPMSTPLQPANNLRKPRFATPIPQDPQRQQQPRQQGFQSTLQQQQQVQPRPYRLATNGLASLLYQNQPDNVFVPESQRREHWSPIMNTQWINRYRFSELNETQIGPSRSSFSTSYKQAFTYDQSYITSHPALPKLGSTVDPADLDNIHDIFFNEKIDGRKKMERILQLWELDFENERTPINIDNLFAAQICRPIDDEHAEDLAHRLADVGEGNFSTILNKSLFMIFEETIPESGVTRYGVIDGNIRLAAVHNYNENVTSSNLIRYITADYILKQKPSIAQAIAISTMASKVAHEDQLEYNEEQILRNARLF